MPRFVILEHDHPTLHWDFMLESGNVLRTWRLPIPPRIGEAVHATPLGNHRIAYLEYEGPLSGNRGTVKRWDQGEYEMIEDDRQRLMVRLSGERMIGMVVLDVTACP